MIDYRFIRYITWFIMFSFSALGGSLSDTMRRLSRSLRLLAYMTPWIVIGFGRVIGKELLVIDTMQLVFLFLSTIVCIAISLYSEGYLRILFGKTSSIQIIMDASLTLLVMLFMARNLLELTILWISVEFIAFLMILLEKGIENWNIGMKYLIVCATVGDLSLFTWIAVSSIRLGLERALIQDFIWLSSANIRADPVITILLLIGFMAKLAQIPLHFWLVDTYTEAPSPVSAIFSGLMSKMAVYGILRLYDTVLLSRPVYTALLLILGFITVVYASIMAVAQTDIKKMIAYSSMSHYGVMAMLLGLVPFNDMVKMVLYIYVLYHGVVKAHVFTNIATIEILVNIRDLYRLGYLSKIAHKIYEEVIYGVLSLIGLPPSLGFLAKLIVIYMALVMVAEGYLFAFLFLIGIIIASVFSIIYSIKYLGAYVGSYVETPIKPVVNVSRLQYYSELFLAYTSVILPVILMVLMPMGILYPTILLVYLVFLATLFVSRIIYNKLPVYETSIWLGGVET